MKSPAVGQQGRSADLVIVESMFRFALANTTPAFNRRFPCSVDGRGLGAGAAAVVVEATQQVFDLRPAQAVQEIPLRFGHALLRVERVVCADRLEQPRQQCSPRHDAADFDVFVRTVIEPADRTEPIETRSAGVNSDRDVRAAAGRGTLERKAELGWQCRSPALRGARVPGVRSMAGMPGSAVERHRLRHARDPLGLDDCPQIARPIPQAPGWSRPGYRPAPTPRPRRYSDSRRPRSCPG